MATIAWPAALRCTEFAMTPVVNARVFRSPYSQSIAGVDLIGSPWSFIIGLPPLVRTDATLSTFLNQLHGPVNNVPLWDMNCPQPQGTMRGTPTVSTAAAQGAQALVIQSTPGATLVAGDKLGVLQMLLEVAAPVTFDGSGLATVTVTTRLRKAVASGSAVTWDKPTVLACLDSNDGPVVNRRAGVSDPLQCRFIEVW